MLLNKLLSDSYLGKGDVTGSYTSDALLNDPDIFFDHVSLVFKYWLIHGMVTLSLLACAFLPLYKGGLKDPSKTGSYRAIAGASLLLKFFDLLSGETCWVVTH